MTNARTARRVPRVVGESGDARRRDAETELSKVTGANPGHARPPCARRADAAVRLRPFDAQTLSVLQGRVFDSSGGLIQGAAIRRATTRPVSPCRSAPIPKGATHRCDPRRDVRGRAGGTRFLLRDDRSAERRRRLHAGARLPSGSWRKTRNSVRSRGSPRLRRWPKLSSCDRHGPGPSSSCRRSIAFEVIAASDGSFAGRWFSTQLCPVGRPLSGDGSAMRPVHLSDMLPALNRPRMRGPLAASRFAASNTMLPPWSCADWITVLPACGPPVITWSKRCIVSMGCNYSASCAQLRHDREPGQPRHGCVPKSHSGAPPRFPTVNNWIA